MANDPITLRVASAVTQTSASCRQCHEEIYAGWSGTDHALANRPLDPVRDRAAFSVAPQIHDGGSRFDLAVRSGQVVMTERREGEPSVPHEPGLILGAKPLWQPLVPAPGGRWQPTDLAFDVQRKEWFNVFGQEGRHPGEWGHWTGRGMNWNSMCAPCHMTGYQKNYQPATDRYASTWVEHGIGCIQCHGPMPADHNQRTKPKHPDLTPKPPFLGNRDRMMQTCAPCHARNEPLTADFQPGDRYDDHYRVTLPVDPAVFYPDGQQREEDFNWTSLLLSRMGGHGGVTCLDCHDPHTNKTILPVADNQLCLRCHTAPGVNKAPPIDPLAHSHHQTGSTGNQCVTCHMPVTNYMQRAPRHDHGWLKPDPLLTKELGIPNACNRCHTDKSTDWAVEHSTTWYGPKLDSHQRARTRAVAAAQARRPEAGDALLAMLRVEQVPAWRATLLELASSTGNPSTDMLVQARASLKSEHPIERAAAVRLLGQDESRHDELRPLLEDQARLVRLDAAWTLSATLAPGSAARTELDAYLALGLDQPTGRLRLGQDFANRGLLAEAEREIRLAAAWDPLSPGIPSSLGFVLNAAGQPAEAGEAFLTDANLQPTAALPAYQAGLAFAAAGRLAQAEAALRLAVARDRRLHRAWYNLGLLLAQTGRKAEATQALQQAEALTPDSADYSYALATVLWKSGHQAEARAAARRALTVDPDHAAARQLLESR